VIVEVSLEQGFHVSCHNQAACSHIHSFEVGDFVFHLTMVGNTVNVGDIPVSEDG
jgi:hypothetical protein